MSNVDANTLKWVKSEIDETLKQAQTALEAYVEDTNDESQIRFCINYLHQVYGTLQMVELHGAGLAVEEMEKLALAILEDKVSNREDAYETLMRGILQVPDYLEHLLAGNPDMPVVLLPLLNDIRAARNEALLSEGALFTPDLSVTAPATGLTMGEEGSDLATLARKLRHNYHLGLLAWFKNTNPTAGLKKIAEVVSELGKAAASEEARKVFWIANGLVESLIDNGVENSVAVKMLLGHVDRQIKKIIDNGDFALDEEPPEELEKNLLYYVASSTADGELTREIKQAYDLTAIMPDTQTVEQARADLTAPNAALMDTVSSVIVEDINKVKDNLDIYVRADEKDNSILETAHASLVQMADTLAMLNLGVQREAVLKQADIIENIVKGEEQAADNVLMDVAAAMIAVENSLSEVSTARAASAVELEEESTDAGEAAMAKMQTAEQHKLTETVLEEAKVNLSRVKDALTEFVRDNDAREQLKPVPALLEQVQGSLLILSLEKAASLLMLSNNYIRENLIKASIPPSMDEMNHLADAISSLEYYMESLMGQWGQPQAILDVAEQSLQSLGLNSEDVVEAVEITAPEEESEQEQAVAEDIPEPPAEPEMAEIELTEAEKSEAPGLSGLELSLEDEAAITTAAPDEPEAIDISIPEAEEETIAELPLTEETDSELDEISLDSLSLELGDDTAAEELNEISLDEISSGDDITDLNFTAAESIELEAAEPEAEEAAEEAEVVELTAPPAPVVEEQKEPVLLDDTIDDEIIEIFLEEAEESYETITALMPGWIANPANHEPLKEIRRAYHTLKGSGRLVGASDLGEFAWAFENMLNRVLDNTITASPELLELMGRARETLPVLFEQFKHAEKPGQEILDLMAMADALSQGKSIDLNAATETEAQVEEVAAEAEVPEITEEADEEISLSAVEEEIPTAEADIEVVEEEPDLGLSLDFPETEAAAEDETQISAETETESASVAETVEEQATSDFPVEIDPVLLDIYRKEVATHIETLKEYIHHWHDGEKEASQPLLRALHTLTGSSRTTGVDTLATVCSTFEHYVKHLQDVEMPFPQQALAELDATIQLVENTVACLDIAGATLPEHEELLSRIEALPKELAADVTEATEPAPAAAEATTPAAPVVESNEIPDYDEELLEIFLEEGNEILDDSDQVIQDWAEDPENMEHIEELQRQLHTLKGGARMAGITELGDLGHSIESLLTAVVDGHMKASKPMFDLVQRAQDRLAKMMELVSDHKGIAAASDLIAEVDHMLEHRGEAEHIPMQPAAPAPEAAAIEETAEETIEVAPPAEADEEITPEVPAEAPATHETELTLEQEEEINSGLAGLDLEDLQELEKELRHEHEAAAEAEAEVEETVIDLTQPETPTAEAEEITLEEVAAEMPAVETAADNVVPLEKAEKTLNEIEENAPAEPAQDRRKAARTQGEQVRVRADLLDNLVNFAGEVSIYRSRLEQQTNNFRYNITEFDETVKRLRAQLRQFEIETEAQIQYRNEDALSEAQEDFDPLEMDRFTTMQHLSRAMMESLSDLDSLGGILNNLTRESETLLLQQSRVNTDLQEGLMRTRMVPFSGQAARLRRIVRQTCSELGKHAELHLDGVETELDRSVLERIISPIEHMLRNAIAHGIETPEQRKQSGKPEEGNLNFSVKNEGSEIVIRISDDGAGINLDAIRNKAIEKGMLKADAPVSREMLFELMMQSGFSTADSVNQIAGRGVGMDVVNTEIKQLGGVLSIDSQQGKGTTFTVSLPLTLAITRALMVNIGEDTYAIPLLSVEGVERVSVEKIREMLESDKPVYHWLEEDYEFMHLASIMGISELDLDAIDSSQLPLLMVRSGDNRRAILVDSLLGSREIVVKSVGPQLSTLRGISGATIMGDGSVVLIIDLGMIIRLAATMKPEDLEAVMPVAEEVQEEEDTTPLVMVVDDSITVRKVTTRLLERHDMRVVAAKDGVDALAQLQETLPDIMLLDVEMPRMDGFELATNVRKDERLKDIPIIMITSRTGQKHRDRAASIGVNIYMGKPYTESDLLDNINVLTGRDL